MSWRPPRGVLERLGALGGRQVDRKSTVRLGSVSVSVGSGSVRFRFVPVPVNSGSDSAFLIEKSMFLNFCNVFDFKINLLIEESILGLKKTESEPELTGTGTNRNRTELEPTETEPNRTVDFLHVGWIRTVKF